MSKLLVDVRTLDLHTTPPAIASAPPHSAALGLVDRASLRLGLWLLLRGAQTANHRADRGARDRLLATRRGLDAREHAALRRTLLTRPLA